MPHHHRAGRDFTPTPPDFSAVLTDLRRILPQDLDPLIQQWLGRQGVEAIHTITHRPGVSSYQGWAIVGPLTLPIHIWCYRRRTRIQVHHVDACIGWLQRHGLGLGVLVTTGGCAPEARRVAIQAKGPALRVITGPEFVRDLADRKLGVRKRTVRAWLLDLRRVVAAAHHKQSRRKDHA